jgi:beta-galactosidase
VKFAKLAKGRYLALEALNALDGKKFAAMTEVVFLGADGKDVAREECSVIYADSEEVAKENGSASLVLDNQPTTWWHTAWSGKTKPGFPHVIAFDLGMNRAIGGFRYQPRRGSPAGRIGDYKVYLSEKPFAGQ